MLGPQPPGTTAFELTAQAMHLDLKVVHHASPEILALYEAPMVLIRPDQIVAWRGHSDTQAKAVLKQVMGQVDTVRNHTTDLKLPT